MPACLGMLHAIVIMLGAQQADKQQFWISKNHDYLLTHEIASACVTG